jgi:protein SCO1/2
MLLSVTLDPAHDRPGDLAKYASIWKASGAAWRFLTGPGPAVEKVAGMFGVVYNPDEGAVTHSLHTLIIDRGGDLVANLERNEFTVKATRRPGGS